MNITFFSRFSAVLKECIWERNTFFVYPKKITRFKSPDRTKIKKKCEKVGATEFFLFFFLTFFCVCSTTKLHPSSSCDFLLHNHQLEEWLLCYLLGHGCVSGNQSVLLHLSTFALHRKFWFNGSCGRLYQISKFIVLLFLG
jgi:hypothetical protein